MTDTATETEGSHTKCASLKPDQFRFEAMFQSSEESIRFPLVFEISYLPYNKMQDAPRETFLPKISSIRGTRLYVSACDG